MNPPFGTGAVARPTDTRDYSLGLAGAPTAIPATYLPDVSQFPVKMQGKFGTCGGHAGSALESFLEMLDLSPKYLWKQVKQIDGIPLDGGTDMRSIFKSLQNTGDCHENLCPNTLDADIQTYSNPFVLTDTMTLDAYNYGINSYAFIDNPTWNELKQSIYQNRAILAMVRCGDGWYTAQNGQPSWLEKDVLPSRLGMFSSNHFIVLWGYDEKYIYFRNSWSDAWGRKGDGYFDISYLPNVLEIGTAIDGPSIKQQLITKYRALVVMLTALLKYLTSK